MTLSGLLRKIFAVIDRLTGWLSWIAPLLTRLVLGLGFYMTGTGKWHNIDNVVKFFTSLHIPQPWLQAHIVAMLELVGGICLLAGLFTRFFASALGVSMVVALMTADHDDIVNAIAYIFGKTVPDNWTQVPTDITSCAYFMLCLWLAMYGAGYVSLDWLIGYFVRKKVGAAPDSKDHPVPVAGNGQPPIPEEVRA